MNKNYKLYRESDLSEEQIEAVVNWMNGWDMFRNTAIPLRFKEAFTKSKISVAKLNDESEIKIGDRVKLKGDSNSPEMTVIGNASQDARYQYKGVQDDTIQSNDVLKCSWFPENEEDSEAKSNRPMQTVEIHRNALQVIK